MTTMRISEVAERSGVPATALRYYETAGLLTCERSANGYRSYHPDTIERLAFIGAAKHLGLTLDEIAELLEVWQHGPCAQVKADLRPRITARLEDAQQRTAELTAFRDTLRQALDHLDHLPDRTERCDPGCSFLSARRHTAQAVPVTIHSAGTIHAPGTREAQHGQSAPIACSLGPSEAGERTEQWWSLLGGAAREQIPDGLRLILPLARLTAAAELAAAEQACCPFLDFSLHLHGPELHLEVRAPSQARALLDELFNRS